MSREVDLIRKGERENDTDSMRSRGVRAKEEKRKEHSFMQCSSRQARREEAYIF